MHARARIAGRTYTARHLIGVGDRLRDDLQLGWLQIGDTGTARAGKRAYSLAVDEIRPGVAVVWLVHPMGSRQIIASTDRPRGVNARPCPGRDATGPTPTG